MAQVTGHRAARAFFFMTLVHTRAQTGHTMSNWCTAQFQCTFQAVAALAMFNLKL